jgi:WD40 repeat protein
MKTPAGWNQVKEIISSQQQGVAERFFPDANTAIISQQLEQLEGHDLVHRLVSDPHDPKVLASGSAEGNICLWDITTGRCLRTLRHPGLRRFVFNPGRQGELAVMGCTEREDRITIWNTTTGDQNGDIILHKDVQHAAYNRHDANQLATSSLVGSVIKLWNLEDRRECRELDCGKEFHIITSLAFDPTTPHQLIAGSSCGAIKVWNTKTGEYIHTIKSPIDGPDANPIDCLKFNPCVPEQFAFINDGSIQIWKKTVNDFGEPVTEMVHSLDATMVEDGRQYPLSPLNFTWNQTQIAVKHHSNKIKLFDIETGKTICTIRDNTHAQSLAFCPDNRLAAGLDNGAIKRWNIFRSSPVAAALQAYMAYRRTYDQLPANLTTDITHLTADLNKLSHEEQQFVLNG